MRDQNNSVMLTRKSQQGKEDTSKSCVFEKKTWTYHSSKGIRHWTQRVGGNKFSSFSSWCWFLKWWHDECFSWDRPLDSIFVRTRRQKIIKREFVERGESLPSVCLATGYWSCWFCRYFQNSLHNTRTRNRKQGTRKRVVQSIHLRIVVSLIVQPKPRFTPWAFESI